MEDLDQFTYGKWIPSDEQQESLGSDLCCVPKVGVFQHIIATPKGYEGYKEDWGLPDLPDLCSTEQLSAVLNIGCLFLPMIIEGIRVKIGFSLSSRIQFPAAVSHLKL